MADNKLPSGDRKPSYISPLIIGILVIALGAVVFLREPAPEAPKVTQKVQTVAPPAPTPKPKKPQKPWPEMPARLNLSSRPTGKQSLFWPEQSLWSSTPPASDVVPIPLLGWI